MTVDSSALVLLLLRQPGHERVLTALQEAAVLRVGAPTLVEAGMVLTSRAGLLGRTMLARFVTEAGMTVVPFDGEHWAVALQAFIRFGKGRHPARLNFGDCMTYAVAHLGGEPLLCTGDDFAQTDLPLVG